MTDALVPHAIPIRAVLHPTDFSMASDFAFAHALKIALAAKAKFYILHTEQVVGEEIDWTMFPGVRARLARWGLLDSGSEPGAVAERTGLAVRKVDVVDKDPVRGIVNFFHGHPSDLIVLATHGREGRQLWLGKASVAEPVARQVRIPALFFTRSTRGFVDPDSGATDLRRILVPIDHEQRPERAAAEAVQLARMLGSGPVALHLLHVGATGDVPHVSIAQGEGVAIETHVRTGAVVEAILAVAAELDVDLIVMATQGHQGFLDAIRGSTTEQILRRADRPLLAVPAD